MSIGAAFTVWIPKLVGGSNPSGRAKTLSLLCAHLRDHGFFEVRETATIVVCARPSIQRISPVGDTSCTVGMTAAKRRPHRLNFDVLGQHAIRPEHRPERGARCIQDPSGDK